MGQKEPGPCVILAPLKFQKRLSSQKKYHFKILQPPKIRGGWCPDEYISKSIFPSDLKLADVTPVYKKKSKNSKDNYSRGQIN